MPHSHPSLRRPILPEQLLAEFDALWSRCRGLRGGPRPKIALSGPLGTTHCRNARRYAEVDCARRFFYFAPQVLELPLPNRRGLIGHEIGHVVMFERVGNHSEADADAAALFHVGVNVHYDGRWPGRGLQTGRLVS